MKKLLLWLSLIVAGVLRFYNNTAVALWHDEAFSALYISKYGWGEMMHRIILDVHPPLYYIALRLWAYPFGHSLLSLRGFSILFGILTVWAGYLLVRRAFKNESWAILAAFLLAINPFQVQYALEARMYTLGTFLALISCYFLVRALETAKTRDWLIYGFFVAACAYTHYFLFFTIAAQGVYFLYYCFRNYGTGFLKARAFWGGAGAYIFSAVLFIPWIPSFLEQAGRVEGGYWIGAPDRWSVPGTVWKMVLGGQGSNHRMLLIACVITLAILVYFIRQVREQSKWLIFFGLVVPFVISLALSYKQAIYLDRYFVFASLFFSLLIALALGNIPNALLRRILISAFIVLSVMAFFKNWKDLDVKNLFTHRQENKKPGMAKIAEVVNDQAQPDDHIFVGSSFIFFTFQYYNHTGIRPLLLSDVTLDKIPHFSGTAIMEEGDLQITQNGLIAADAVKSGDNIWLVWTTGFGGSKPNVPGSWYQVLNSEATDTPGFKGTISVTEYQVR